MAGFKFKLISAKKLYSKELPPIEYLVDDFVIKRGFTYIAGPPASFKTGTSLLVAIAGACKKKVFDFNIKKPFRTLFIDEENGIINTKDRLVKITDGLGINVEKELGENKVLFSNIASFQFTPLHIAELEALIKEYKPDLIIIDNIARCLVGSERDEKDVSLILKNIKPLIEEHGVSFIIIHHTRKGNAKTLEDISGSRDFGGQCDNAFLIKQFKRTGDTKHFVLTQVKSKYGLEMPGINFTVHGDDKLFVTYTGNAGINISKAKIADKIKIDLYAWITKNPNTIYKTTELIVAMTAMNYADTSIREAIQLLVNEKVLVDGNYGEYTFNGGMP